MCGISVNTYPVPRNISDSMWSQQYKLRWLYPSMAAEESSRPVLHCNFAYLSLQFWSLTLAACLYNWLYVFSGDFVSYLHPSISQGCFLMHTAKNSDWTHTYILHPRQPKSMPSSSWTGRFARAILITRIPPFSMPLLKLCISSSSTASKKFFLIFLGLTNHLLLYTLHLNTRLYTVFCFSLILNTY